MSKRFSTSYPGVFYRMAERIGGKGMERVYYIVFKKDGKIIEEKVGRHFADDMSPAKAAHIRGERIEGKRQSRKKIREMIEEQRNAAKARYTIGRLWSEYKMNRTGGKALETDEYRYNLYIKPEFESVEPKDIVKLDIDRLRIRLLKTRSPQTVKHVLNLLTWIINYGKKNNLCAGVNFHISKPAVNNLKTEDLTSEELSRLLETLNKNADVHAANMMKMALFTGMRRGELFKLKWDDIDFERGFITIRDPKGGSDQKIPLNDAAREVLSKHPRDKSSLVFPGRFGGQLTDIKKAVNKIKEDAALPKNFRPLHGLRHVYASMLASSGQVDMYTLQKLLTHKSPLMTQRYAHLRDDALKRASDLAGSIIQSAASAKKEDGKDNVINLE